MSSTLNVKLISSGSPVPYGPSAPRIRVAFGAGDSDAAAFQHYCDGAGTVSIELLPAGPYRIHPIADGYEGDPLDVVMPHDDQIIIEMVKVSSPTNPIERVAVSGRHFVTGQGRFNVVGADSFLAYERYLNGEDLTPVFAQLQSKGFNTIRVFGMAKYICEQIGKPVFKPQDHPDYYDKLKPFCDFAAQFGLYVYFVVFADTGWIMPDEFNQIQHFHMVVEELKKANNTFGSLGNELEQHENFVDKTKMVRPEGIAFSSGSEGMDQVTPAPWWDFDEFHPRRDRPSSIKDCNVVDYPNYVNHGVAVMVDEPDRFGSGGVNDPDYCALQAGASVESAIGIVFHSKDGIYARVFDGLTETHADAFTRVLVK